MKHEFFTRVVCAILKVAIQMHLPRNLWHLFEVTGLYLAGKIKVPSNWYFFFYFYFYIYNRKMIDETELQW